MSPFTIEIPKKDFAMQIRVEKLEKEIIHPTYNLFYNEQLSGCMYCNENSIWIYEPHGHEALLLDVDEIKLVGKQISDHSKL